MAADIGFGTTITFQSGFLATITNIELSGFGERSVIDTSHMLTTNAWRTKLPGDLKNAGKMTVEMVFNPNQLAAYKTAAAAAAETTTITFPIQTGSAIFACSGFMTGASIPIPMDDKMSATIEFEFTGEPTLTSGT